MRDLYRTGRSLIRPWGSRINYLSRCYAAVLFCNNSTVGLIVLAITLTIPNIGIAGFLAAVTAYLFASRLGYTRNEQEPYIYNSLLVGLSLGSLYCFNWQLTVLILLGAVFTLFLTQLLTNLLWRMGRLPVLSLPFVLVTWTMWLAAKSITGLEPFTATLPLDLFNIAWISDPFKTLGLFFFIPQPLAGLILFLGILWTSRYLALLAVCGYFVGYFTLLLLFGSPQSAPDMGFNFMLVAMCIGGVFTVPGKTSFILALFASALSAIIAVATSRISMLYQLPVLTMPFIITTACVLAALSHRTAKIAPYLLLENPALPEQSYERMRLAKVRLGEMGSIPLFAPFFGEWCVYQGFNGSHTHKPPWQHALDFFITHDERSFDNEGLRLEDYYCFGAMIVAPAAGQIVACRDDLSDNPPGEVDLENNWGNYVLLKLANGMFVLLAHLRQHSLAIKLGDCVQSGQGVANCGNSGRSPQPHLHMHVQNDPLLGSPTLPFHLSSIITRENPSAPPVFQLIARPKELMSVTPAQRDESVATPLHLPVGRILYFRFRNSSGEEWSQRWLRVDLTLLGQFRLVSDTGASVAFEETAGLLAFYDRQGNADVFLDMWLMAMGLTPFSNTASQWRDQPAPRLLPLRWWQRSLLLLHPLSPALGSFYKRHWDSQNKCWQQKGRHRLFLAPRLSAKASTLAVISPLSGCTSLTMQAAGQSWEAVLDATGIIADNGIPADSVPLLPGEEIAADVQGAEA